MYTIQDDDIVNVIRRIPIEKLCGQTIFVTGATGFIGAGVVATLLYLNDNIFSIKCKIIIHIRDVEKAKWRFGDRILQDDVTMIQGELVQKLDIITTIDYIIHAASNAITAEFGVIPVETLSINMTATQYLLELAQEKQVKGFLFLSSGAVHGDVPNGINVISEEDVYYVDHLSMNNSYAIGKMMGESLCRAYFEEYGIPSKVVRISHTYGPGINISDGKIFSDFVKSICERKPLIIKGDGKATRPFAYINDTLVGVFLVLLDGRAGEVYNLANSSQTYSIADLAEKLCYEVFPERRLKYEIMKPSNVEERPPVIVDTSKIENLGWEAEFTIDDGFKRVVSYYETIDKI